VQSKEEFQKILPDFDEEKPSHMFINRKHAKLTPIPQEYKNKSKHRLNKAREKSNTIVNEKEKEKDMEKDKEKDKDKDKDK